MSYSEMQMRKRKKISKGMKMKKEKKNHHLESHLRFKTFKMNDN